MVSKKWAKNDVDKIMLRGDHRDGLVVLIPKVYLGMNGTLFLMNGGTAGHVSMWCSIMVGSRPGISV